MKLRYIHLCSAATSLLVTVSFELLFLCSHALCGHLFLPRRMRESFFRCLKNLYNSATNLDLVTGMTACHVAARVMLN
jgi:hypothetical protein